MSLHVTSLKELRFKRAFRATVHQQYDFSCGSAALATLLTYHYGRPVTEQQVFQVMYQNGNQARIREVGFSMLDMKLYLEANGFPADGFEASIEQMQNAGVPAIVLLQDNGYNHFVVLKGIRQKQVLVGDPALGSRIIPVEDFKAKWPSKIAFVITGASAPALFNTSADWNSGTTIPLGSAISRESLAAVTLLLPRGRDF